MGCGQSRPTPTASEQIDVTTLIRVSGAVPGATGTTLERLDLAFARRESDMCSKITPADALEEDIAHASPGRDKPNVPSPRRRRRISPVIDEFTDTFHGYMENRDHPFLGEDRLRRLFQLIDADQSGTLDISEVQDFWKRMGWSHSENSIKLMFNLADSDHSGAIDYQEFSTFFRHLGSAEELRHDPEHDDWVPPSQRKNVPPRGRIWPPRTRPIRDYSVTYLVGNTSRVKCISVDPSRAFYSSCARDDRVMRVYDLNTGELLRALDRHRDTIVAVAMSPDCKHLATASRDGLMILWDSCSAVAIEHMEHPGVVTCCAFSPGDGKCLFSGCQDGVVRRFQVSKGKLTAFSEKLGKGVIVCVMPNDKIVAASLSREKSVHLLDPRTLRPRWQLQGHESMVWSVGSSEEGKYLMSTCEQFVKVWEATTLRLLTSFPVRYRGQDVSTTLDSRGATAPAAPDARWTVACYCPMDWSHIICAVCSDRSLYFYNTRTANCILQIALRWPVYCISPAQDHPVLCVGDESGNVARITLR
eukprot:TRINITY_DN14068_c0_g1_i1.p1 TRINITY_DN14068_c0_g1~~TRINITY_DN14068_c0_g1_i1.p1  ORF type:complete len:571 (+),score=82.45 TRINITY_DN14068_c0_g1_i1:121-1713(+)